MSLQPSMQPALQPSEEIMKTKYDALEELATKATQGHWHFGADECPDNAAAMAICKENVDAHTAGSSGHFFVVYLEDGRRTALVGHGPDGEANASFIAAARNAVPTLIADVKALAEALTRLSNSYAFLKPPHSPKSDAEKQAEVALSRLQWEAS